MKRGWETEVRQREGGGWEEEQESNEVGRQVEGRKGVGGGEGRGVRNRILTFAFPGSFLVASVNQENPAVVYSKSPNVFSFFLPVCYL